MSKWQPIETAPQDELVLVWVPAMRLVRPAKYHSVRRGSKPPSWNIWLSAQPENGLRLTRYSQPTLWQPMPAQPDTPIAGSQS